MTKAEMKQKLMRAEREMEFHYLNFKGFSGNFFKTKTAMGITPRISRWTERLSRKH
jgi:hypothetical protein